MWRTAALAPLAGIALAFSSPGAEERARRVPAPGQETAPDGLLILAVLSTERAIVADPRSGRTTARELPSGTLCHGPLLAVRDRLVFVGLRRGRLTAVAAPLRRPESSGRAGAMTISSARDGGRADDGTPQGPAADDERSPGPAGDVDPPRGPAGGVRSLDPAEILTASPAPGRVWLGSRSGTGGDRLALREVDPRARITGRRVTLPAMSWVQAVIDDGVVVVRGTRIVLVEPDRRVNLGAGWPLAAAGSRLAWCPEGCRRIRVWSSGTTRTFEPPAAIRPEPGGNAAFSPDGRRLALTVNGRGRERAAVVDLESGRWRLVPGGRLAGYGALAWSPSGRWLYFSRGSRVLASRGGAEPAVRLPIRTGGSVMDIASTP